MRSILSGLIGSIWLWVAAGCGAAPTPPTPAETQAATTALPPPPPEPAWEEQLAAVRSGTTSRIKCSAPVTREQFQQLGEGCAGLTVLQLAEVSIDDADLAILPELVSLRQLVLEAPIGDAGMKFIAACPSLEIVNLPQSQCSDEGLGELRALPLLTLLRIGSPHLSDAGMEHLAEMPNLRFLHLIDVPITDQGLEPLKRVKLLESFYIDGGRCTDEGLGCLMKVVPGLHLHVNQLHLAGDEHTGHEPPHR